MIACNLSAMPQVPAIRPVQEYDLADQLRSPSFVEFSMIPTLSYWFAGFAWVSALAFLLVAVDCFLDVREKISERPIKFFRTLLSLAILLSVGLAWWVAAAQEAKSAPRVIADKDKAILLSKLKDYATLKPKISVCYSNDEESQKYARQWEQVLKDAGWDLIEEKEDLPDHQVLSEFYGMFIRIKDTGAKAVSGAPARLGKAIQGIGIDVRVVPDKRIQDDEIRLEIGAKDK